MPCPEPQEKIAAAIFFRLCTGGIPLRGASHIPAHDLLCPLDIAIHALPRTTRKDRSSDLF
jgi:hypothetical protein